jgi:hypothetical protein
MKSRATYTADFAEVARAYCSWCEASHPEKSDAQAAYWLSRLYSQALMLPQVAPESEEAPPEVPAEALGAAELNLATFAGRLYREVFDPDPSQDE